MRGRHADALLEVTAVAVESAVAESPEAVDEPVDSAVLSPLVLLAELVEVAVGSGVEEVEAVGSVSKHTNQSGEIRCQNK